MQNPTDGGASLGTPSDALYVILVVYFTLPTLFIPLTFSLVTSLKGLYREYIAAASLRPWVPYLTSYQDKFFQFNDAFAEMVIVSGLWGIWSVGLTLAVLWFHSVLNIVALGIVVPLLYFALPHFGFGKLLRSVRSGVVYSFPTIQQPLMWQRELAHHPDLLLRAPLLLRSWSRLWNLNVVLLSAVPAVAWLGYSIWGRSTFPGAPLRIGQLVVLAMTLHLGTLVWVWWDMYVQWRPFSTLKQADSLETSHDYPNAFIAPLTVDSAPVVLGVGASGGLLARLQTAYLSRAGYRTPRLSAGFIAQQRTYDRFMHQYERDDGMRLASLAATPWKTKVPEALRQWSLRVRASLRLLPPAAHPVVSIWYVGCGHCGLIPQFIGQCRVELPDCDFRVVLVDPVTINRLRRWKQRRKVEASEHADDHLLAQMDRVVNDLEASGIRVATISSDVLSLLRLLRGDLSDTPVFDWAIGEEVIEAEAALGGVPALIGPDGAAALDELGACMASPCPPLFLFLNNTYGDILDPEYHASLAEPQDYSDGLLSFSRGAATEMWRFLCQLFDGAGLFALLHTKASWSRGNESGDVNPYSSHWARMVGTSHDHGIYLLGRPAYSDVRSAYLMLARWGGKSMLVEDLDAAIGADANRACMSHQMRPDIMSEKITGDGGDVAFALSSVALEAQPWNHLGWSAITAAPSVYHLIPELSMIKSPLDALADAAAIATGRTIVVDFGCLDGNVGVEVIRALQERDNPGAAAKMHYVASDVNEGFMKQAAKAALGKVGAVITVAPGRLEAELKSLVDADTRVVVVLWNVLHHLTVGEMLQLRKVLCGWVATASQVVLLGSAFAESKTSWWRYSASGGEPRRRGSTSLVQQQMCGSQPKPSSYCLGELLLDDKHVLGLPSRCLFRHVLERDEVSKSYGLPEVECLRRVIASYELSQ